MGWRWLFSRRLQSLTHTQVKPDTNSKTPPAPEAAVVSRVWLVPINTNYQGHIPPGPGLGQWDAEGSARYLRAKSVGWYLC